jgi:hypothetical protein
MKQNFISITNLLNMLERFDNPLEHNNGYECDGGDGSNAPFLSLARERGAQGRGGEREKNLRNFRKKVTNSP